MTKSTNKAKQQATLSDTDIQEEMVCLLFH